MPDYADVWDQYDLAVSALYDAMGPAEALSIPTVRSLDVTNHADLVITTSGRLAEAAAQDLTARSAAGRERSTLRLVAGAAADIAIANDLMQAQGEGPAPALREAAAATYPQLMSDLGPILRLENGVAPEIATRGADFKPRGEDAADALTQLRRNAERSFDDIADDVIDVGQTAISGLLALEVAPVRQAAAVAAQELLRQLSEGLGSIMRQATRLVVMAYDKILTALGKDAAAEARQQAARWIEMLESGTLFAKLLHNLYDKQRVLADIEAHAKRETQALMSEVFSEVLAETRDVAERFRQHRRSVEWVLRGLAFTKDWLFTIQPWGPLAVTAVYVGSLGYVVYAGGDYVDWFHAEQLQPLNRVPGLREVVRETLKTRG
ncbi:MAG: hypothetical protein MAG451_02159 [Anaerolineales bacterium]|nr:hypothetical protein [Anaerolineales bacterium]